MGDEALMQVTGEQRDALRSRVMPEEVACHADLAAAAGPQHGLIEPGPVLDLLLARGLQTGERDRHHGNTSMRTPVLAGVARWRQVSLPERLDTAWKLLIRLGNQLKPALAAAKQRVAQRST